MMGKSHVITGACALGHAYVASVLIDRADIAPLTQLQHVTQSYLGLTDISLLSVPLCLGAYFIGTLLPDIDNPKSMLGRFIHIPVKHRTWLHAIYLYILLAIAGYFHPIAAWMFFGVFVHLFWDSPSACGNCWFYKLLSDYREYPNGAKIKKGHKFKLYHAGELSEYVLVAVIVVFTILSFIWLRRTGL